MVGPCAPPRRKPQHIEHGKPEIRGALAPIGRRPPGWLWNGEMWTGYLHKAFAKNFGI